MVIYFKLLLILIGFWKYDCNGFYSEISYFTCILISCRMSVLMHATKFNVQYVQPCMMMHENYITS
jgi:hypothetical protein